MSVDIEPLELSFRRPFTREVSQTLTVKNPSTTPVVFKAMKQEPAADAKCRDKFLVQSAPITGDKEFESIASVFESTEKSAITERKIRVNWLPPLGGDDVSAAASAAAVTPRKQTGTNGLAADTPDANRSFNSPSAGYGSPNASEPPPYSDEAKSEPEDVKAETPKSVGTAASTAPIAAAAAATDRLDAATATSSDVRQRSGKSSSTAAEGVVPQAPGQLIQAMPHTVQGVSVPVTASLCLLAFLIGYLFF
ncbi:MSP (Major sperm protein) domain [Geosmithia morbida]|uniref:MSP (Major sperm protein) domain n=1 Tax=Geosmithia morbida TaxID=1094350 RepID=A0A9P5D310_9HYPO|nr:MSP (Major sperm protein) domain [Geosmithia morbida]KAF4120034.1 MSP (Major sperm protein) domain [Geosmithia morbida]